MEFRHFRRRRRRTTGLILTGSRSIFLGFCWILLLAGVIFAKRKGKKLSLGVVAKRMTSAPWYSSWSGPWCSARSQKIA